MRKNAGARTSVVVAALTAAFALPLGEAGAQVCGDANGDGQVTVTDGVDVLRAAAGLVSVCAGAACDVDGSGLATVSDGVVVLRIAADLPTPGVCEDDGCDLGAVRIDENHEIPAGRTCTLTGTQIDGNLVIGAGARLLATDVFVGGNVQTQGAARLVLVDSEVRADVQFEQGGEVTLERNAIGGNVQLVANTGAIGVIENDVDGDVQVFQNQTAAPIVVTSNTVGGNLQCKENVPAPTGGSNLVEGNKEDQCAAL